MEKVFDSDFLDRLLDEAGKSVRKRQNYDLRNSAGDTSQRMLNALLPGTAVPVHCHRETDETVVCLKGRLEEVFYERTDAPADGDEKVVYSNEQQSYFRETARYMISPMDGLYGMQIPAGVWHTVEVMEPSVIFEAKDGAYKG